MNVRGKVKTNARRAVTQNYIKALSVTLILLSVALLFTVFVMVADMVAGLFASQIGAAGILETPGVFAGWNYVLSPLVVLVSLFFEWVLFSPLLLGCARWFYRLSGADTGDVIDLFDYFSGAKHYFGALWMEINLFVRRIFYGFLFLAIPFGFLVFGALVLGGQWRVSGPIAVFGGQWQVSGPIASVAGSMLLIAGTVLMIAASLFAWVFLKRYMLARYLYVEGDCTVRQAIKQSMFCMKGRKAELFVFDLSFIGWFLSCVVVIPVFYAAPYYLSAHALYARVIIERNKRLAVQADGEPTREFGPEEGGDAAAPGAQPGESF